MVARAAPAPAGACDNLVPLANAVSPPRLPHGLAGGGTRRRIGTCRRADRRWLAASGDPVARRCHRRVIAGTARSNPRARTCAHPSPRLRRQPPPDACRDAAVLSPGGVVAVEPDPRRARALLR